MISYDLQDKFEIHGDGVSSLYTWQDNRCDTDFIESLPQPDSHLKLATGYGCATIFWFLKNRCYLQQQSTLFVFLIDGPKQNAGSLLTPVSNTVFNPFHIMPSVSLSMVALITTYFKESDWLLKNLHL